MWKFSVHKKKEKKSWNFLDNSEIFDTKFDVIQQIVAWFNAILILIAHMTAIVVTCKELNYRKLNNCRCVDERKKTNVCG